MDPSFWHQRWAKNEIGFHEPKANPLLVTHFKELSLPKGCRVFVPLCGKTLDIAWLLSQGYRVAGAELSEVAIAQLFAELRVAPQISTIGTLKRYNEADLDIFVGNIFDLSGSVLGAVDAVYDRAALVALPDHVRARYTAHLMEITNRAPQLLISYVYDQRVMDGPPFSVPNEEVAQHYGRRYDVRLITSTDVPGGLKGKCAATENVWLLR
ncbi:MAG: thiopurine S-methyltransferase [Nitrospirota bacterium]